MPTTAATLKPTALALACAAAMAMPSPPAAAQASTAGAADPSPAAAARAPSGGQPAPMARPLQLALPAQPLALTIDALARQSGVGIGFDAALAGQRSAPALQGTMTLGQALERALSGSGLAATAQGAGVAIRRQADTGSATTLPAVTVTAEADRETATGPVSGYVARRSSTATKTDTPLLEVPQSISVVGREEMQDRGVQDLSQAIGTTPGVMTGIYGPDNRGWEYITVRGFSARSNGYRDGLARTPAGVTYYQTELYGLERVEVLRGPSSMVFGQGDAGGVVHQVSKQPTGERIRELEAQVGSFQRRQLAFDLGDRVATDSPLSYRLVGVGLDSNDQDIYPDGHKLNRTRTYLAPSLRWEPDAATSLTLQAEYLKDRSAEDPYYIAPADHVLTNVKMGDYSFGKLAQEQTSVGYRFAHRLNNDWTLRQNVRVSHLTLDRRVVWLDSIGDDGRTVSRIARTWNDPMRQTGVDTHLQGSLRAGGLEHQLLLGIDWNNQKAQALRLRGPAPDLDLLAPVYGLPIAQPTTLLANYTQTLRQVGVYVQDQVQLGERWLATVGGRQDHVKSVTDDHRAATRTAQSDSAFSGRAGLTYLVGNGLAPYLGYAESFLPNSGTGADGQPFQPSRGRQWEAGVKYQPEGTRTLLTAAVFDLRKTNVVTYDNLTFDARQVGQQRSRGLELEAKAEPLPGLKASAAYTWLDTKTVQSADRTEVGKAPPGVPRQSASLWLDYLVGGGLGIGGGITHVGRRQNDEANTSSEPSVTLFDAALHYEIDAWRFALNVRNLFDRRYYGICYHGECYNGLERAMTLTARVRF
ncbi:TonB-dependent siderophore receptor [Pseudorhodoferax sp. Leaf274]|uniref:TonB-dependent siderophore receptor n=1 Tax=Pseudorhodoferax sp. Leaf274 TaxID=1736318 RepID=UPI000702A10C|nr:TonB-dependent siderophore receptor [Pseudorhodoferax sp. Leaf274]KQP49410.1 TonB-dependent receptor [Pseudorhodoferax sp. Leaf274]